MTCSIIVPVHNASKWIRVCLNSVLNQTYTDWECICVDDGSIDSSGEIVKEYEKADPRIRYVRIENSGVSVARNVGMSQAIGDVLTFLDADDFISKRWIEVGVHAVGESRSDIACLGFTKFYGDILEEGRDVDFDQRIYEVIDGCEPVIKWGWPTFRKQGWVWRLFVRKGIVSDGFPEGVSLAEDSLWALSLLRNVKRVCCVDFAGYYYRQHNESATSAKYTSVSALKYLERLRQEFNIQTVMPLSRHCKMIMAEQLARGSWFGLYTWVDRPEDRIFELSIGDAFWRNWTMSTCRRPLYACLAIILYHFTGSLFPVRFTLSFIKSVKGIRRFVKSKIHGNTL